MTRANISERPKASDCSKWQTIGEAAFKWIGRVLAAVLFIFWSAFFVEHVNEWYLHPENGFPPLWVLAVMFTHLGMLIGLLAFLRWRVTGTAMTLLSTVGFMIVAGLGSRVPYILLVNLAPAVAFAAGWLIGRSGPGGSIDGAMV